jgi:hypothetical protein
MLKRVLAAHLIDASMAQSFYAPGPHIKRLQDPVLPQTIDFCLTFTAPGFFYTLV